jgi:hypothetical protein
MLLSRRPRYHQRVSQMFERCQHVLALSFVGAIAAIGCTPVLLRSQGNRTGLVAISAKTDSAFSRCAQAAVPIDTVTPASEPFGVVDPRNPNHLVISWMQRARFGVTVLRSAASFDGGESWPYVTTLPLTSCATRAPFSFHTSGDPWLAVGGNGPIYASGLAFTEDSASGIAVTTSHDGGRSWQTPIIAMAVPAKQGLYDNSSLAVDPRNAAVAFVLSTRTESLPDSTQVGLVVLSKTSDGGLTWSTPRAISPNSPGASADLPQMAIDPVGGRLFVVYTSGVHGAIWLLVSTDAGESWSAPSQVATFTPLKSPPRFPGSRVVMRVGEDVARLAMDPRSGRLFVAFADGRFSRGERLQIGITASSDGGRTWSLIVAGLSDTTVAAWQPTSAVLRDGSLVFSYFTAASMAGELGGSYPTSVRVARVRLSDDGTVLERHESRALQFPWQPGPRQQGMFLGDYHSLLVVGHMLCPLFGRSFGPSTQIALTCVSDNP